MCTWGGRVVGKHVNLFWTLIKTLKPDESSYLIKMTWSRWVVSLAELTTHGSRVIFGNYPRYHTRCFIETRESDFILYMSHRLKWWEDFSNCLSRPPHPLILTSDVMLGTISCIENWSKPSILFDNYEHMGPPQTSYIYIYIYFLSFVQVRCCFIPTTCLSLIRRTNFEDCWLRPVDNLNKINR